MIIDNPINSFGTREGADTIARRIEAYWANRGFRVKARVERAGTGIVIRSDMVDGLPVGFDAAKQLVGDVKALPVGGINTGGAK